MNEPQLAREGEAQDGDRNPAAAGGLKQFGVIRIRPAHYDIVAVLIDAIRSGYFQLGDRLPPERELAEELGVSRPVVRAALDILEEAGMLEVRRGRFGGTTLVSLTNLPEILSEIHGEHSDSIVQLLEVRLELEMLSCLRAADHARTEDIETLRRISTEAAEAIDGTADYDTFVELTVRFHIVIAVLSHNPTLAEFMRVITNRMAVAGRQIRGRPSEAMARQMLGVMRSLVTAIEANDRPAVERLVHEHITAVRLALAPPTDG
ncbi:MAG: FadR family transcriptional regulator [Actinobacteria bacterium]|nr:FadR family transcriptional regulator [Actinomycetota bacterium]